MIDDLLSDAESIVARATAAGADQAEAYLERGASLDLELEQGRLAGAGSQQSTGGSVRLTKNGRTGFAYFSQVPDADAAIQRAFDAAKLAPPRELVLPSPERTVAVPGRWDEALVALDPAMALTAAKELLASAHNVAPDGAVSGGIAMSWGGEALANSNGLAVTDRSTMMQAFASIVHASGDSSISAWDSGTSHNASMDVGVIGRNAAETTLSLRDPAAAVSGPADLVLRPSAGAELITGLIGQAVHGDTATRGRSFWSERLATDVAHPGFSVIDEPHHPKGIATTPIDGDGAATQRTPIIEGGRLKTYLFDARDAGMHGTRSTGHAQRDGFKAAPSAGAHHMVIEGPAKPEDALIADIDRGYLIDSLLGAHTANGTTGDFSVTAPNVWRIEKGAVVGACKEIAIGGNLPDLLFQLDGVSVQPRCMPGAMLGSLRLRDAHVSA